MKSLQNCKQSDSNDLQNYKQSDKSDKPKKRHTCLQCYRTFSSRSSLSTHRKRCQVSEQLINRIKKEIQEDILKNQQNLMKNTIDDEKVVDGMSNSTHQIDSLKFTNFDQTIVDRSPTIVVRGPNSNKVYNNVNNNKLICMYCQRSDLTSSSSLSKHMNTCRKRAEILAENKKLKKQLKQYKKQLEKMEAKHEEQLNYFVKRTEKMSDEVIKDKDKFADIASVTVNKSMSALSFCMANYKNAPQLAPIEDISKIKVEYKDDTYFAKEIVSKYQNSKLVEYIGDFIVNIYKKEDCSQQSIWSSDVSRLTYIISEAVEKNKTTWTTDKNGIKVGELIVKPTLEYIKKLLQIFVQDCSDEIMSDNISASRCDRLGEYQKLSTNIIIHIDNNALKNDIMKYLAPRLFWNKTKTTKIKLLKDKSKSIKSKSSKPSMKDKIVTKPKKGKIIEVNSDDDSIYSDYKPIDYD